MSGKHINNVAKILTVIIVVLVLVAAIVLIFYFTNGGTTDFKTFYVQIDDTRYTRDSEIEFIHKTIRFETKYVFSSNSADKHKGYNVKIVPHITDETNFDFTVDGKYCSFGMNKDFTSAFDIVREHTGFTVTSPFDIKSVLEKVYDGQQVELPQDLDATKTIYFNIIVSAYNDGQALVFGVRLYQYIPSIELDKEQIVLW